MYFLGKCIRHGSVGVECGVPVVKPPMYNGADSDGSAASWFLFGVLEWRKSGIVKVVDVVVAFLRRFATRRTGDTGEAGDAGDAGDAALLTRRISHQEDNPPRHNRRGYNDHWCDVDR